MRWKPNEISTAEARCNWHQCGICQPDEVREHTDPVDDVAEQHLPIRPASRRCCSSRRRGLEWRGLDGLDCPHLSVHTVQTEHTEHTVHSVYTVYPGTYGGTD